MAATTMSDKKLSLGQFVWLGFNYTVGIGFIGNLAILSNFKNADGTDNPDSVGVHILWIFILLGFVASICALAFAKLAKIHKSDNNGGAYVMSRTVFGRFTGWLVVFIQYIILPFIITVQIFNLLKAFFSGAYAGSTGMNLEDALGGNSHWAPLILDIGGIFVYFAFSFVILGGMKLFKKMTATSGYIKWATSFILIIGAIYLASSNGEAANNYSQWFKPGADPLVSNGVSKGFNAFVKAFNSCFFFFAGFETFATAGKNIKNPEKNLGRGILIIMLVATLFYLATMVLFFGAINPSDKDAGFIQNMNMGLWTKSQFDNYKWLAYTGMGLMIFSQLALKANVSMQNALYGGTMLQPMSQEGYISEKFSQINKDGIPIKASVLNFVITLIVLSIWLIVPDLIQGITKSEKAIFNVSQLTEASSAITLFIYFMVLLSLLTLAGRKKIKLNVFEWGLYLIVASMLVLMFGYHYAHLFINLGSPKIDVIVGAAVELVFILSSIIASIVIYLSYYKPKLKKRLSTPEGQKLQQELDSEFVLVGNDISIFFKPRNLPEFVATNSVVRAKTSEPSSKLVAKSEAKVSEETTFNKPDVKKASVKSTTTSKSKTSTKK